MPLVGVIANPASGKDIRRLVAHATSVDNQGKVSIVRRALIGLGAIGIRQVWAMPETHHIASSAMEGVAHITSALPELHILDMAVTSQARDSERAAELLRQLGAGCIITLGGDGTSRVVSKAADEVPLLPISTGTNNVIPSFVEGTIAGLAAGAVALGLVDLNKVAIRHKWLEVLVNDQTVDRALVDVAVLRGRFLASRAVWQADDIYRIVTTRANPASIGISAVAGVTHPVAVDEARGVTLALDPGARRHIRATIGPGLIVDVGVESLDIMGIGDSIAVDIVEPSLLALDGEREVTLRVGDALSIRLRADGPWIVDSSEVMKELAAQGRFNAS